MALTSQPPVEVANDNSNLPFLSIIWVGTLEWQEKPPETPEGPRIRRQVQCDISIVTQAGEEPDIKGDDWSPVLRMDLIPKQKVTQLGGNYIKDVKTVRVGFTIGAEQNNLIRAMDSGFGGCVYIVRNNIKCPVEVLILLYSKERKEFYGFLPIDQPGFVDHLRQFMRQLKADQMVQGQGQSSSVPINLPGLPLAGTDSSRQSLPGTSNRCPGGVLSINQSNSNTLRPIHLSSSQNNARQQQPNSISETSTRRETAIPPPAENVTTKKIRSCIWKGVLELIEKQKDFVATNERLRVPGTLQCQVFANNVAEGETELKSSGWPAKLKLQLIPNIVLVRMGDGYFVDAKSVMFVMESPDAFKGLKKATDSGFVGCVHFIGKDCAIKVLILHFSEERHGFAGLIPKNQERFLNLMSFIIQQEIDLQEKIRKDLSAEEREFAALLDDAYAVIQLD